LDSIAEMLGNGVDQPSLFAQGHFLLTAKAQQQSGNAPQNLKHLPPTTEQASLTH